MASTAKRKLRSFLIFIISASIALVCAFILRYLFKIVFDWFGGVENIGWKSILLICVALYVVLLILKFIVVRRGAQGISREAVVACSEITLTTTILFGVYVLLRMKLGEEDSEWILNRLPLFISIGIGNYLYNRMQQRETENDVNGLVVVAECSDMASAEKIYNMMEANDIKTMIVEKDSPIYINGSDAAYQIQVCRKDMNTAKSLLR